MDITDRWICIGCAVMMQGKNLGLRCRRCELIKQEKESSVTTQSLKQQIEELFQRVSYLEQNKESKKESDKKLIEEIDQIINLKINLP